MDDAELAEMEVIKVVLNGCFSELFSAAMSSSNTLGRYADGSYCLGYIYVNCTSTETECCTIDLGRTAPHFGKATSKKINADI